MIIQSVASDYKVLFIYYMVCEEPALGLCQDPCITLPDKALFQHDFTTLHMIYWSFRTANGQNILYFREEPQCFPLQESFKDCTIIKVENILKGSLDLIPSPSPSVKIQIMGGKVCLSCKSKTLLGLANKLLKTKSLLTSPSNVLPYYLK